MLDNGIKVTNITSLTVQSNTSYIYADHIIPALLDLVWTYGLNKRRVDCMESRWYCSAASLLATILYIFNPFCPSTCSHCIYLSLYILLMPLRHSWPSMTGPPTLLIVHAPCPNVGPRYIQQKIPRLSCMRFSCFSLCFFCIGSIRQFYELQLS